MTEAAVANELAQDEFEREISILARLNHVNVVEMLGSGSLPSSVDPSRRRPLVVLEALSGDTLAYLLLLKRPPHRRPFSESRYLRMARELLEALEYIHYRFHPDCTIIHRDLKPDNLGFSADGTLKLMDFGLSVCIHRHFDLDAVFELSGCTGSLRYMAPEVALELSYNEKVSYPPPIMSP
jgi:serine/threonine protein kinase